MLKLSSIFLLVPALNGLYVNTNGTLLLVLSLWLVVVDVRSVECEVETFLRSFLTRLSGYKPCTRPEVFLRLRGSLYEISTIRADPA